METPGIWAISVVALELLIKLTLVAVILIRARGHASSRLTWIVVIMAIPFLGTLLYLMVGEVRLGSRRLRRYREIVEHTESVLPPTRRAAPKISDRDRPLAFLAEAVGHKVPVGGNALQLISDTGDFIESLVTDIDAATTSVHLLFYIFLQDHSGRRVAEALLRAEQRGVECRLLVDAYGSREFAESRLRGQLEAGGVQVVEALPGSLLRMLLHRVDLRNHRKIVVIDGRIGYMGSHNIADAEFAIKPKYAPWIDTTVRLVGPITRDLEVQFVEDWYLDTDELLDEALAVEPPASEEDVTAQFMATGPHAYNEALRQVVLSAVNLAREEVILTTPYFVPDEATMSSLRTAARRGVEIHLVVPARNDSPLVALASRSHYQALLDSGVHVHEYTAGLLHAKTLTIDRDLALVTTANLDRRSFELNFEASLLVFDTDFASRLRFLQTSYLNDARSVDAAAWRRRPWAARLVQNAAGTLGPLL